MTSQNIFNIPTAESPGVGSPAPAPYGGNVSMAASSPGQQHVGIQDLVRSVTSQKVQISDYQVASGCANLTFSHGQRK